jgi:phosphatidylserine/phosphatidylglycerophosphate/cardiolipin synthase-like enzyme
MVRRLVAAEQVTETGRTRLQRRTVLSATQRTELRERRLAELESMRLNAEMSLVQLRAQRESYPTWEEDLHPTQSELDAMQREELATRQRIAALDAAMKALDEMCLEDGR